MINLLEQKNVRSMIFKDQNLLKIYSIIINKEILYNIALIMQTMNIDTVRLQIMNH